MSDEPRLVPADAEGTGPTYEPRRAPVPRSADLLSPVRVATVADEVADRLITAIALGDFTAGERLPGERDLARLLEVGRPAVREALGRLRAVNAVEVRRGRGGGTFVVREWSGLASAQAVRRTLVPRMHEIEPMLDLRCLVESLAAHTAATRVTPERAEAIMTALEAFESARGPGAEHTADIALHEEILRTARNPALASLVAGVLAEVSVGLPIEPYDPSDEIYERTCREHRALAEAVAAGEAERAMALARHHFTIAADTLRRTVERSLGPDDVADRERRTEPRRPRKGGEIPAQ